VINLTLKDTKYLYKCYYVSGVKVSIKKQNSNTLLTI